MSARMLRCEKMKGIRDSCLSYRIMPFAEEKIREMNTRIASMKGNLAVWGIGEHTRRLLEYTKILDKNVMFFIDSNARPGMEWYGRKVFSPKDVDLSQVENIVISSYKYQDEIEQQIYCRNFEGKIVKFYDSEDEGNFYDLPSVKNFDFYFSGNFLSWEEAANAATGYDEESIVQTILTATQKVINHEAIFERDGVCFQKAEYNFVLLTIFGVCAQNYDTICIVDFGGALGSEYWRNKNMLQRFAADYRWNVIEQNNYVKIGREYIADEKLRFYNEISEIDEDIHIVILSGVLQYLQNYSEILTSIIERMPRYILIDRQPVGQNTRICVQHVGENIYKASYPARIIEERELKNILEKEYVMLTCFESWADKGKFYVDGVEFQYKGFFR